MLLLAGALYTPKAKLLFSLAGLKRNNTEVGADQGYLALIICDACKYAKEPADFFHPPDSPETQRNRDFPTFYPETVASEIALDISIPESVPWLQIGMVYHCKNCLNEPMQVVTVDVVRP